MEIIIRLLEEKDVPHLKKIVEEIYPHKRDYSDGLEKDLKDMWSTAYLRPQYFVAEEDGVIVGFIGYGESMIDFGIFQIFWVMVLPAKQKQGIGKKMVSYVLDVIKETVIILSTPLPKYFKQFKFETMKIIGQKHLMILERKK